MWYVPSTYFTSDLITHPLNHSRIHPPAHYSSTPSLAHTHRRMFPMAKYWPGPGVARVPVQVQAQARAPDPARTAALPPAAVQDVLVRVFFTYVNPAVPVVDEEAFMRSWRAR